MISFMKFIKQYSDPLFLWVLSFIIIASLLPNSAHRSIMPSNTFFLFKNLPHFFAYATLALFYFISRSNIYSRISYLRAFFYFVFILFLSIILERLQMFVPGRVYNIADIVSNIAGTFTGLIVCFIGAVFIKQKKDVPTHVLFISSWYPSKIKPYEGNFVRRHALAASRNVRVSVLHVVFDDSLDNSGLNINETTEADLYELHIYFKSKIPFFNKGLVKRIRYFYFYLRGFIIIMRKQGAPDILHINILSSAVAFALLLRYFYFIPMVVTEHWTSYLQSDPTARTKMLRLTTRYLSSMVSCLMPVSQNLAEAMQKENVRGFYQVIPNVVNTPAVFYPEHLKTHLAFNFLHVSTLNDAQKNVSGLIRVFSRFVKKYKKAILYIISDGDQQVFINQVNDLRLTQNVIFLGRRTETEVAKYMRQSHCFVLYSNYENLPCVIVEAFASGIPVIATDVGGVSEILNSDRGVLINPKEDDALYNAMMQMIVQYDQYDTVMLHNYAFKNFSYPAVGKAFYEVYCNAYSNQNKKA